MKGHLPKAYLRLDPNADAHPDLLAMVTLMLEGNRQAERGRFKSLDKVRLLLGKKRLQACLDRGDLTVLPDGRWLVDGWDEWQEGDYTVGDRMARVRHKRNGVTPETTPELRPERIPDRNPPSEAARQQGSKALDSETETENERPFSPGTTTGNGNGNGLTEAQRQEYADAVWEAFLAKLGTMRLMSPSEFVVLKGWMDTGIPLRIVLRAMQDTKKAGASLAYYAPSVKDAFDYYRKASA